MEWNMGILNISASKYATLNLWPLLQLSSLKLCFRFCSLSLYWWCWFVGIINILSIQISCLWPHFYISHLAFLWSPSFLWKMRHFYCTTVILRVLYLMCISFVLGVEWYKAPTFDTYSLPGVIFIMQFIWFQPTVAILISKFDLKYSHYVTAVQKTLYC